jgi:hypothetical protein
MRRIRSRCCARAATGHATALPSRAMNCRRFIDYLVGGGQQRFRHGQAERLGGLEVDDEFELTHLHDRQIGRFRSPKNASDVNSDLTITFGNIVTITDQAAGRGEVAPTVNSRQSIGCGKHGDRFSVLIKNGWVGGGRAADIDARCASNSSASNCRAGLAKKSRDSGSNDYLALMASGAPVTVTLALSWERLVSHTTKGRKSRSKSLLDKFSISERSPRKAHEDSHARTTEAQTRPALKR